MLVKSLIHNNNIYSIDSCSLMILNVEMNYYIINKINISHNQVIIFT